MAKRRSLRIRDTREHVIARGERKVSLFGKARVVVSSRGLSDAFLDGRAVAKMRALRAEKTPPVAIIGPREPHRGLMSAADIERKLAEPVTYARPKAAKHDPRVYWVNLRAEWQAVLDSPLVSDARRKRALARVFSIDTELELLEI